MKSSLYHRYDVTDLRKHITLTKIPYTPCFHVKYRCLCLRAEPVLPVYDRPQLSSSLPSRLQNVCLCLSRFTSDVPIPTIYINTQRVQRLSLNKPTVFSDTPSFRNYSNMLILFPRNISYYQCWKQFSAAFELRCIFSRSVQNYSLQCGSHLGKPNRFSNSHPY